jgi:hypothetical protein
VLLADLLKVWKAITWKDRDFEKRNHNTDFVRVAELFPVTALPSRFEVFWFQGLLFIRRGHSLRRLA